MLPSGYAFACLRGLPDVILVEDASGRLLAGIMVTRDGWLTNLVAFEGGREGGRAAMAGYAELRRLLEGPYRARTLRLRTAVHNVSLLRLMRRAGFEDTDQPSYMITAPVGSLTMSWKTSHPPKCRMFHVEQQVVMQRRPQT
jgi:hypothetical protein